LPSARQVDRSFGPGILRVVVRFLADLYDGSETAGPRPDGRARVDELAAVALWLLGFVAGGPLIVVAVMAPPMAISHGLVWLGMRAPGRLGRWVRAWQQKEGGTPLALLTRVQVLGFLVALWTGFLGRLLRLVCGAAGRGWGSAEKGRTW
jgi:hypothetical protein